MGIGTHQQKSLRPTNKPCDEWSWIALGSCGVEDPSRTTPNNANISIIKKEKSHENTNHSHRSPIDREHPVSDTTSRHRCSRPDAPSSRGCRGGPRERRAGQADSTGPRSHSAVYRCKC